MLGYKAVSETPLKVYQMSTLWHVHKNSKLQLNIWLNFKFLYTCYVLKSISHLYILIYYRGSRLKSWSQMLQHWPWMQKGSLLWTINGDQACQYSITCSDYDDDNTFFHNLHACLIGKLHLDMYSSLLITTSCEHSIPWGLRATMKKLYPCMWCIYMTIPPISSRALCHCLSWTPTLLTIFRY